MKIVTIVLLSVAIAAGCNHGSRLTGKTEIGVSSNLTFTAYHLLTPDGSETTAVHELWSTRFADRRLVTTIFSDDRGHVITLTPTPLASDDLPFSPGIFHLGGMPDHPLPILGLSIDRRGHIGKEHSFQKRGNLIFTHEAPPGDVAKVISLLQAQRVGIVSVAVEGGAPLNVLTNEIGKWARAGADIRLSMIPWELTHPSELVDEADDSEEPQPSGRGYSSPAAGSPPPHR